MSLFFGKKGDFTALSAACHWKFQFYIGIHKDQMTFSVKTKTKTHSIGGGYKMKNNIIISGVPRAGKSTISHLLAKQYGYQHISMDSIIAGFEKCFPETGVNTMSLSPAWF